MSLEGNSNLIHTNWESPAKDPMDLLKDWVKQAKKANISEPLGMTLSTVSQVGWLWNRVVLVKELEKASIIFGSNSLSDKGQDIEHNPRVAGSFWWRESVQQIHFRGFASIASLEKSNQLFQKRSRSAQAAAICSQQSQLMTSESDLKTQLAALNQSERTLTRPSTWQAYQITPIEYEFWQGDASRWHKRLRYSLQMPNTDFSQLSHPHELDITQGEWIQQRLQP